MYTILLIGAGKLGGRHLQSLAKVDMPMLIEVVDPNYEHLQEARGLFEEVPDYAKIHSVFYHNSLGDVTRKIDLCIIATTADIRSRVTKEILDLFKIDNIIFEKVLFQSLNEYDEIDQLLKDNAVKAWVNCPRRMQPFYSEIRKHFRQGEAICYHLNGGDWGLACNSIHFIDHLMFLVGMDDYDIDVSGLDKRIYPSKRKGFIEFGGTLKINCYNGSEIILHSKGYSHSPHVISILGETCHVVVFESLGKALIAYHEDEWQWNEIKFHMLYQSELTHLAAIEILTKKHCNLTSFGDSLKLHKPMIQAFTYYFEHISNNSHNYCPIT